ncbi:MAG: hypothetical protein OEL81_02700 [Nitrosopumilus sp.]|nr:hypothetical protein [Nitrosopumilus sp.]
MVDICIFSCLQWMLAFEIQNDILYKEEYRYERQIPFQDILILEKYDEPVYLAYDTIDTHHYLVF